MDDAFLALLHEKELAFITVQEICARAQVSRSTFYLHYDTVEDLLQESVELLTDRFRRQFRAAVPVDVADAIKAGPLDRLHLVRTEQLVPYLTFVRENKDAFAAVVKHASALRLDDRYQALNRRIIGPILDRFDVPELERPYLMAFYIKGLMAIIETWIRNGCSDPLETIADIMGRCCNPNGR